MALYYLNYESKKTIFYTDTGTLRNVLRFAGPSEYVRITNLIGHHDLTNKLMFAQKTRSSAGLTCLNDFLPATIHLKALSDTRVIPYEFTAEFDSGIKAYTKHHSEVIVEIKQPEGRLTDLLEAFRVPIRVCPSLLTNPGIMYNVTLSTGSFVEWGHFKSIQDWLHLIKYEKPMRRLGIQLGHN